LIPNLKLNVADPIYPELAIETGITEKGIEYNLTKLKKEKKIVRIGGDKGGHWALVE